jgi:hypothetical protein
MKSSQNQALPKTMRANDPDENSVLLIQSKFNIGRHI